METKLRKNQDTDMKKFKKQQNVKILEYEVLNELRITGCKEKKQNYNKIEIVNIYNALPLYLTNSLQ